MGTNEDVKVPQTSRVAFEAFVQGSGAHIHNAVHAPAREVVAVESPSGGFEIRVQETGLLAFARRIVKEVVPI